MASKVQKLNVIKSWKFARYLHFQYLHFCAPKNDTKRNAYREGNAIHVISKVRKISMHFEVAILSKLCSDRLKRMKYVIILISPNKIFSRNCDRWTNRTDVWLVSDEKNEYLAKLYERTILLLFAYDEVRWKCLPVLTGIVVMDECIWVHLRRHRSTEFPIMFVENLTSIFDDRNKRAWQSGSVTRWGLLAKCLICVFTAGNPD